MLSVVIPVYNEEAVLEKTASVIRGVLSDAAIGCELIFVEKVLQQEQLPISMEIFLLMQQMVLTWKFLMWDMPRKQ